MKKLFSFVMAAMLSMTVFAHDYTAPNGFTGAVGQSFSFWVSRSAGSADYSRYMMTYTVTKAASGSSLGTLELSITPQGGEKITVEEWKVVFDIKTSSGTKIGTYILTSLADNFLKGRTDLTSITLDYENQAIWQLSVGSSAFENCTNLTKIEQKSNSNTAKPANFKDLKASAFYRCSSFTQEMHVDGMVLTDAMMLSGITKVVASSGSSIGMAGLRGMNELTTLDIAGKIYDSDAISSCPKLNNVIWRGAKPVSGDNFASKAKAPFYNVRDQILYVTLAGSVPAYTFCGMSKMSLVLIEDAWQSKSGNVNKMKIGNHAFAECPKLTVMSMAGVVDQYAFGTGSTLSSGITQVNWYGGDPWNGESYAGRMTQAPMYSIRESLETVMFYGTWVTIPAYICYGLKNLTTVNMLSLVNNGKIGHGAFQDCELLKDFEFHKDYAGDSNYTMEFEDYAFSGCKELENFKNFPTRLKSIGKRCFYQTYSLTDFPITASHTELTSIGEEAFVGCGAETVIVPSSVTTMGGKIFGGYNSQVKNIYFLPETINRKNMGGSYAEIFMSNKDSDKSYRQKVEKVVLNQNLTAIPDSLFYNFKGMAAVYPAGKDGKEQTSSYFSKMTRIGAFAFYNTQGIKDYTKCRPFSSYITELGESCFELSDINGGLYLLNKLTVIPRRAFYNSLMENMNLGNDGTSFNSTNLQNLTTIGDSAFAKCTKMTSIAMPYKVSSIGKNAFKGTDKVTTVVWGTQKFTGENPLAGAGLGMSNIENVYVAGTVTSLPAKLFSGATNLKNAYINSNLAYQVALTAETAPFAGTGLTKAVIRNNIGNITDYLFAGAGNLTTVTMPDVVQIGEGAFLNTKADKFTLKNVKKIGPRAFYNSSYTMDTVFVEGKTFVTDQDEIYKAFSDNSTQSYASRNRIKVLVGTCSNAYDLEQNSGWNNVAQKITQLDNKYKVPTIYDGNGGTVTSDLTTACDGYITLTAVPQSDDYTFLYWTDGNSDNPRILNLEEYSIWLISPTFYSDAEAYQLTLDVTPEGVGHVEAFDQYGHERSNARFMRDETAILRPISDNEWFVPANSGYSGDNWIYDQTYSSAVMNHWSEDYPGEIEVRIEVMPGMGGGGDPEMGGGEMMEDMINFPQELTAKFVPKPINVEVRFGSNGGGTFEYSGEAILGQEIEITALPHEGYEFVNWNFDKSNTNVTTTFKLELADLYKENMLDEGIKVDHGDGTYEMFEESANYYVEILGWFKQKGEGGGGDEDLKVSYVCDFTKIASKNANYSNLWTYDNHWNVYGGANNNGGWDYVKMGAKSGNLENATPVYVVNKDAYGREIKQIKVVYPAGSFSKGGMGINEWGVKVYKDAACSDLLYTVKGGEITGDAQELIVKAESGKPWKEGYHIQVYWDLTNSTSTNGIVFVNKIEYHVAKSNDAPLWDNTVGVDQLDAAQEAQKVLRNGQILIIRGGKTYNLQGMEVK